MKRPEIPRGPRGEALMVAEGMCPRCGGHLQRLERWRHAWAVGIGECFACDMGYRVTRGRPFGDIVLEKFDPVVGHRRVPVPPKITFASYG